MSLPEISVVIPSYDRPQALARCLAALEAQSLDRDRYEIVVVDDGTEPPLRVPAFPRVRLLRQPNAGPAAARNHGAREARAPRLAFTDDDCAPAPAWLGAMLGATLRQPGALAAGRTLNAVRDNVFSQSSQDVVSFLQTEGEMSGTPFVASNNLALDRAEFLRLGGFPETYRGAGGEDRAFCLAWARAGHRVVPVPRAVVHHHHAMGWRGFWRQHAAYGRGSARFHTEEGAPAPSLRQRVAFTLRLLAWPLRGDPPGATLRRSALLAFAQVATAWGRLRA